MLQISSNSKPPLLRNYIFYQFYTIVSFTLILGNVFSSFCRVTVDSTTVGGGPMFKNRFISGDGLRATWAVFCESCFEYFLESSERATYDLFLH